jgi:hypothetical protein
MQSQSPQQFLSSFFGWSPPFSCRRSSPPFCRCPVTSFRGWTCTTSSFLFGVKQSRNRSSTSPSPRIIRASTTVSSFQRLKRYSPKRGLGGSGNSVSYRIFSVSIHRLLIGKARSIYALTYRHCLILLRGYRVLQDDNIVLGGDDVLYCFTVFNVRVLFYILPRMPFLGVWMLVRALNPQVYWRPHRGLEMCSDIIVRGNCIIWG